MLMIAKTRLQLDGLFVDDSLAVSGTTLKNHSPAQQADSTIKCGGPKYPWTNLVPFVVLKWLRWRSVSGVVVEAACSLSCVCETRNASWIDLEYDTSINLYLLCI